MNPKHNKPEEKFSPLLFLFTIVLTFAVQMAIILTILKLCSFERIADAQIDWQSWKGFGAFVVIFLSIQLLNCFGEWFFHRGMLHAPLITLFGLDHLFKQHHQIHHPLTNLAPLPKNSPEQTWRNKYPITEESQYRASYFPWYSYAAFTLVSMTFLIPLQWLLPSWPVLIAGIFSLGWSLIMYEFIHAIEHLPLPWWQKRFEMKWIGGILKRLYAYHLMHHESSTGYGWNMNISGFLFGLPLADMAFGTFKLPKITFENGSPVLKNDLEPAAPRFRMLRRLDEVIARRTRAYLSKSRTLVHNN